MAAYEESRRYQEFDVFEYKKELRSATYFGPDKMARLPIEDDSAALPQECPINANF